MAWLGNTKYCIDYIAVDSVHRAAYGVRETHRAHVSYRVMTPCMAMGEAVGWRLDLRGKATGDEGKIRKLSAGLVMSASATQKPLS